MKVYTRYVKVYTRYVHEFTDFFSSRKFGKTFDSKSRRAIEHSKNCWTCYAGKFTGDKRKKIVLVFREHEAALFAATGKLPTLDNW